jgi:hypothetical protein
VISFRIKTGNRKSQNQLIFRHDERVGDTYQLLLL